MNKLILKAAENKKAAIIISAAAVLFILLILSFLIKGRNVEEETDYVNISDAFQQNTAYKSYEYRSDDKLLRLIYTTENDTDHPENGFKVCSVKLHDYRAESNIIMLYATVLAEDYAVNNDEIELINSSVIPKAYIFTADTDLSAINNPADYDIAKLINNPVEIIQAKDGSEYKPSIEDFCKTPVTRKEIKGLADKILSYDNAELIEMQAEHLDETMKANGFTVIKTTENGAAKKYKVSHK